MEDNPILLSNFRSDRSPAYLYTRVHRSAVECHNESDYHRDLSTVLKSGCWNVARKLGASKS